MTDVLKALRRHVPDSIWGNGYRALVLKEKLTGGFGALAANAALRDLHRGRRAFVIGNGASLRHMDLSRLRGEVVVTVNSFFEHQDRLGVAPTAHVFFDDWYFGAGLPQLERFAARAGRPLTFLPLQARAAAGRVLPDARWFLPAGAFEHNHNLDLCGAVPFFQTVALPALLVALHLGCDPIYLVGCDMDFLRHVVGVSPLRVKVPYFYDEGEAQVSEPAFDYQGYVEAVARMFAGYRFVRDRLPPGRRVLNATVGGALDLFERVDYTSLF